MKGQRHEDCLKVLSCCCRLLYYDRLDWKINRSVHKLYLKYFFISSELIVAFQSVC